MIKVYASLAVSSVILLLAGCADRMMASDYPRPTSYAFADTTGTLLAKAYAKPIAAHGYESGFHLLPNGTEALMMRIALIEASQKSVDLQYFSTRDDTTGKLLLEAVTRAAKRGVRVRLLLDDWNLDDFESGAAALNAVPHIEVRIFNPYSTRDENFFAHIGKIFGDVDHFTHRMHNKAIIADNQIAIVGGRNLGDEYFDASSELDLRDADVFAVGPITKDISRNFDRYWNSQESYPLESLGLDSVSAEKIAAIHDDMHRHWQGMSTTPVGKALSSMPLPQKVSHGSVPLIWAKAELVADNPVKPDDDSLASGLTPQQSIQSLITHAKQNCIIFSPYFVPDDESVDLLTGKVAQGVKMSIVTNSLASTDMVPAHAGYSHYRQALVEGGVDLFETKSTGTGSRHSVKAMFKPSSQNGLHAKIYVADGKEIAIGSYNFDNRSKNINTEQILLIHSPQLAREIQTMFKNMTSPEFSYRLTLANKLPKTDENYSDNDDLVWVSVDDGINTSYDANPHAGFMRNLTNQIFGILPIEDQL